MGAWSRPVRAHGAGWPSRERRQLAHTGARAPRRAFGLGDAMTDDGWAATPQKTQPMPGAWIQVPA
jgi:hypothetical protein